MTDQDKPAEKKVAKKAAPKPAPVPEIDPADGARFRMAVRAVADGANDLELAKILAGKRG